MTRNEAAIIAVLEAGGRIRPSFSVDRSSFRLYDSRGTLVRLLHDHTVRNLKNAQLIDDQLQLIPEPKEDADAAS